MAAELLLEPSPTPAIRVWADGTDFSVTGVTRTHQLDLTGLAASGAYREGAKADLGANPAPAYVPFVRLEWASAPTAGGLIYCYFAFSPHATAGTLNPAGLVGADGAYTGYSSDADEAIRQVEQLVLCRAANVTGPQLFEGPLIVPHHRYCVAAVRNETDQNLAADAVEMFVGLYPWVVESQ